MRPLRCVGGAKDRCAGLGVGSTSGSSGSTAPTAPLSNRQLLSSAPSYLTATDRSTSLQATAVSQSERAGTGAVRETHLLSAHRQVLDAASEPAGENSQSDWQTGFLLRRDPTNEERGRRQAGQRSRHQRRGLHVVVVHLQGQRPGGRRTRLVQVAQVSL